MLQPNGLAVLAGLGLREEVDRLGRRIDRMDIRGSHGQLCVSQHVPDFGDGLDHCVALLRRDLHRLLLDLVVEDRRVTLRTGTSAVAADQDGSVQIVGADRQETLSADLVVGADGVRSTIRGCADFGVTESNHGTDYVRALVHCAGPPEFVEHWTSLGAYGAAEVADGLTYVYYAAYRPEPAAAVAARDLPALRQVWRRILPEAAGFLDHVASFDDLIISGVRRIRCRRWVMGRLVLLGDAAHAMAPNVGQGANSAMVDALALAEELGRAEEVSTALGFYQNRRLGPVTAVQSVAERLARLSGLRGRPTLLARDAALRGSGRLSRVLDRQVRRAQQEPPSQLLATAIQIGANPPQVGHP
jgi:2-polyprenyl-6-methoxyphenol hydroxylase-like FAD-dependent oxidoreductase